MPALDRLAIHTMTTKPWSLIDACRNFSAVGVKGMTVWRQHLAPYGAKEGAKILKDHGMTVPALCRGGFFVAKDAAARQAAIDDNLRALDDAAAIDADQVVLVCGAAVGIPLAQARGQIQDGIAAISEHGRKVGVKIAIEPLHPMYAADRSAVNTMQQARAICEALNDPNIGIAVDVFHVWWDPNLEEEIRLVGQQKRIFGFHLCDWRAETRDLLNDRGLMGEGCIDLPRLRNLVEAAGFKGWNEVEIFSLWHWQKEQRAYLQEILTAYQTKC